MNKLRWMAVFMLACYVLAVACFCASLVAGRNELALVGLGLFVPAALFSLYVKKHREEQREAERMEKDGKGQEKENEEETK